MSRGWAEIHDFTERQNGRCKIRSNRRSFSLSLPITLFVAVLISLGGWLWLLGGGVLWLLYKILFDDDWTVSSWWRRKRASARIQRAPGLAHDCILARAACAEQNDLGALYVLLRSVAVLDQSQQPATVGGQNSEGYSSAHAAADPGVALSRSKASC
jgi:hypothetical protein